MAALKHLDTSNAHLSTVNCMCLRQSHDISEHRLWQPMQTHLLILNYIIQKYSLIYLLRRLSAAQMSNGTQLNTNYIHPFVALHPLPRATSPSTSQLPVQPPRLQLLGTIMVQAQRNLADRLVRLDVLNHDAHAAQRACPLGPAHGVGRRLGQMQVSVVAGERRRVAKHVGGDEEALEDDARYTDDEQDDDTDQQDADPAPVEFEDELSLIQAVNGLSSGRCRRLVQ